MDDKLHRKLAKRREEGTLRSLSSFQGFVDFSSNDFLGLARKSVEHGTYGATGSRLISGNSDKVEVLETKLSTHFNAKSALFFNSGYDANIGIFSSIPQRHDVVLFDRSIHASVRDGIRLSLASSYAFNHNDLEDLSQLLVKNAESTCYVAVEGLYSMNGDSSDIDAILSLCKRFNAYLIIDEAHSCGVLGEKGMGVSFKYAQHPNLLLRLVTFGKAFGSHGAIVLCSEELRTFLINFARSFIYTTALPIDHLKFISERILNNDKYENERKLLADNIAYFQSKVETKRGGDVDSPIQMVFYSSMEELEAAEQRCIESKVHVKAMKPPTVQKGEESIRICLHSFNSKNEVDLLISLL